VPGKIQLSKSTYELIKAEYQCSYRGIVQVKGKGPMETWFWKTENRTLNTEY
jgi:class 3 adenylate cyclase